MVDAAFILAWLACAAALVAMTGGTASPLVAMLVLPAALAMALARPWAPEAGAGAVLAYAGAAWLAPIARGSDLSPFPETMAVVALAAAAALIAISQRGRARVDAQAAGRIAEVSHELRTPLTHILGFSEMIERRIFGDINERYVDYAGLIRKSGAHLLALVNDLLDLSRIEAGRYELDLARFDIRAIVEEVVRLSADAAERKHIKLGMVTPEAALTVEADAGALRRMLINTIGNALKFTPDGGRVFVQVSLQDGFVFLDTIDNGPGIPEAERETLGEAYERGAGGARAEGTGLGLSLVRALAALHGGALSFHEAQGGGALVRIALPLQP